MNTILRGANFGKTIVSLVSESTKRKLSTSAQRNEKVAVCGASGGMKIGLQVKPPGFGHDRKATFGQSKRLYTTEASRKENIQPWWKFPFINRRGYTSRSYDELKNIDFLEESNLDDHVVPKIIYDELFAKYEKVIEEKKSAEEKLVKKLVRSEEKLLERDKALVILKVRSRIEELELKFLPPKMRSWGRKQKWTAIVESQLPDFVNNIELMSFRKNIAVDHSLFVDTVVFLYGDFSDKAAHKVLFKIKYDRSSIVQMFEDMGDFPDDAKILSAEVILTPVKLL